MSITFYRHSINTLFHSAHWHSGKNRTAESWVLDFNSQVSVDDCIIQNTSKDLLFWLIVKVAYTLPKKKTNINPLLSFIDMTNVKTLKG